MSHNRKLNKPSPTTIPQTLSPEIEKRAIQAEIAPAAAHSFHLSRVGPAPLSSLIPLIPISCFAACSVVAGYLSGDWRATRYVLILECLFGAWILWKVLMAGLKRDNGEEKYVVAELPI